MDTFTLVHVVLSLIGIGSGLVVLYGMLRNKRMNSGTALFLAATVLTSVTGFFFRVEKLLPSHVIGIISLVVLAVAIVARYVRNMSGSWRAAFVVTASIALYLNVFVLIVQLFRKVPALKALAPTQSEPPFAITQVVVMVIFIVLTIFAVKKFHPAA
jgi:hypothetical protein